MERVHQTVQGRTSLLAIATISTIAIAIAVAVSAVAAGANLHRLPRSLHHHPRHGCASRAGLRRSARRSARASRGHHAGRKAGHCATPHPRRLGQGHVAIKRKRSSGGSTSDTTPPTAPANLSASPGDTQVALSWGASTDNVGVAGYRVYRNGVQVGQTSSTSFTDTGLTDGAAYSYYVVAYDAAGNVSSPSGTVSATPTSATSSGTTSGGTTSGGTTSGGTTSGGTTSGGTSSEGTSSGGSGSGPQTVWTAVGTLPLSDAQAAAQVTHKPEQRSGNTTANDYVPTGIQLAAFHSALNQYGQTAVEENPLNKYVDGLDGLANPSTDDLIQWGAHKWGIPEDWLRAEYVQESYWRQNALGDRAWVSSDWYTLYPPTAQIAGTSEVNESMGITQVKWKPDGSQAPGTEPLRWESTAFNIDYQAAQIRYYYDGYCNWCTTGYTPGQQWNSIGAWYSPYPWNNTDAQTYIALVQKHLTEKPWLSPSF